MMLLGGCGASEPAQTSPSAASGTQPAVTPAGTQPAGSPSFALSSTSFTNGGQFASAQVCASRGGRDLSPQLSWTGAPAGTADYVVIMDDEDPPCGSGEDACRHWSVLNISASVSSVAEDQDFSAMPGVIVGQNYQGQSGYAGPCSATTHTYHITLYALEAPVEAGAGTGWTRAGFSSRYGAQILGSTTLEAEFTP